MKIDFSKIDPKSAPDYPQPQFHEAHTENSAKSTAAYGGLRLDISGKVKDDTATGLYDMTGTQKDQGGPFTDRLQGIAGLDMSVQHNYFAVMSNSMSGKDFAQLSKDGFHPGDMEPDELVTGLDRIKVKLAEAGTVIAGYNDDLSKEKIDAMGGSISERSRIEHALEKGDLPVTSANVKGMERALELAGGIEEACGEKLSDSSIRYLMEGGLEPTLENTYQAVQAGEVRPQTLTGEQLDQLSSQMEKVIGDAGLEVNEGSLEDARWLIENRLPLTKTAVQIYAEYRSVTIPFDRGELLDRAAGAITAGRSAGELLIVRNERVFAEIRLEMTSRANIALGTSDHSLDITGLKEELYELTEKEKELQAGYSDKVGTTLERMEEIKGMPLATVADFIQIREFTLTDVYEKGSARADVYKRANESYEALATEVRRDLGDSIAKAFRNADDMLSEMKLSPTEANRRAVRILGYNRMEITEENISTVKEADDRILRLCKAMTPGAVMKLVKEGSNPLDMSVDELTAKLDDYNDGEDMQDERYARYLLRLEKNEGISAAERDGFIGLYRLFRQVEKSDGAVIGSLVDQGAPMTVRNLLGALRSRKARGMDYRVDDDFGGVERILPEGIQRIDTQIEQAFSNPDHYKRKNRDILRDMEPGVIRGAIEDGGLTMETDMETLGDILSSDRYQNEADAAAAKAANEAEAARLRSAMCSEESVIRALEASGMSMTPDNLEAMRGLLFKRGDVFRQLSDLGHQLHIASMIEDFDDPGDAAKAIEDMADEAESDVRRAMESPQMDSERFRSLMLMSRQLKVIRSAARRENYEVPMEINGEITSVNLRVIRTGGNGGGSVRATLHTEEYGSLQISIRPSGDEIDGFMIAGSRQGEEFLSSKLGELSEGFAAIGEKLSDGFSVMRNQRLDISQQEEPEGNTSEGSVSRLYSLAKVFLRVMGNV